MTLARRSVPETPFKTYTYVGGADSAPDGVNTLFFKCSLNGNEQVGNAVNFLRVRRFGGLIAFNLNFWQGSTTNLGTGGAGPFLFGLPQIFSSSLNQIFTCAVMLGVAVPGAVGPLFTPLYNGSGVINTTGTNWGAGGALYNTPTLLSFMNGAEMTPTAPVNWVTEAGVFVNGGTMFVASGCFEAFSN